MADTKVSGISGTQISSSLYDKIFGAPTPAPAASNPTSTSGGTTTKQSAANIYSNGGIGSNDVKALQTALQNAGYSVGSAGVDGIYGKDTDAAVKQWYKDNGWTAQSGMGLSQNAYNKITGTGTTASAAKPTTGGTTTTPTTTTPTTTQKVVGTIPTFEGTKNGDYYVTDAGKSWNQTITDAGYKYYAYDKNGFLHGSNTSQEAANNLAQTNAFNVGQSITGKSGTVYSSTQSYVKPYTITNANGLQLGVNVTFNPNGSVANVQYANGATPTVGDKVNLDNGQLAFYVEGDDYTPSYWATGTPDEYIEYITQYKQDANWREWQAQIEAMQQQYLEQLQAANKANVEMSVNEIKAQLENGQGQYDKDAEEAYLQKMIAENNQQLRNAAAGDLGGIGQKQYSAASATYDTKLNQIALEKENFINSCNQQIAQLEAQGRFEEAQILSDWARDKIAQYDEDYKWYLEYSQTQDQIKYQQTANDREYNYNRAMDMLKNGVLTADAAEALGIDPKDAKDVANRLNEMAQISLAYAQAELDNMYAQTNKIASGTTSSKTPAADNPTGNPSDTPAGDEGTVPIKRDGQTMDVPYRNGELDYTPRAGDSFDGSDGVNYTYDGKGWVPSSQYGKAAAQTKQDNLGLWLQAVNEYYGSNFTSEQQALQYLNNRINMYDPAKVSSSGMPLTAGGNVANSNGKDIWQNAKYFVDSYNTIYNS